MNEANKKLRIGVLGLGRPYVDRAVSAFVFCLQQPLDLVKTERVELAQCF